MKLFHFWTVGDNGDEHSHSSQSDEDLKLRLLQLFNLPTSAQSLSIPRSTEPKPCATDPDESANYISLDCNALAESLATIPLHERLGLGEVLLENSGHSATVSSHKPKSVCPETEQFYDSRQSGTFKAAPFEKQNATLGPLKAPTRNFKETATVFSTLPATDKHSAALGHTFSGCTIESHDNPEAHQVDNKDGGAEVPTTTDTEELDDMLDELLA